MPARARARAAAAAVIAAVVVVVVAGPGCPAHVMLDAPPPASAPEALRTSYYEQHRPEPPERGEFAVRTRMFEDKPTFTRKAVHLHNGVRVAYVEDLRPLVVDGSATAAAIDASVDARGRADVITGAGMATAGVGAGAGAGLVASYLLEQGLNDQGNSLDARFVAGVGAILVGVVGGGALVTWGMSVRDDEEDARTRAFTTLDAALRNKLALP